jgi:hypothetical protein
MMIMIVNDYNDKYFNSDTEYHCALVSWRVLYFMFV